MVTTYKWKCEFESWKTYNNTSEDFRAQDMGSRSHESNPASFVLHQYRPHHLNTNRSPDPRKGKYLTLVFPLSEERFDCTIRIKCIRVKLKIKELKNQSYWYNKALQFKHINVKPTFFAWFANIEMTKYVFKGSKSQVGSSRRRTTGSLTNCTPIANLLYSLWDNVSTWCPETGDNARSARTCLTRAVLT